MKLFSILTLLFLLSGCWEYDTKNTSSDEVEIVDGHTLPPDPGEAGKETLLGIDSNHDGVRDDVERWIYKTYEHPIERGLFMQNARAYQKVIMEPYKAHETTKYLDDALSCEFYWTYHAKDHNESFYLDEYRSLEDEIKGIQFNTAERFMAYEKYNEEFDGEVFSAPSATKEKCRFNDHGELNSVP
ncbi:hypothetical protein [Sulfurimonas diazotrophicus]|uniref:Lipoprotein n=1 Tax=Sulfurimonas diazotrophicus TaxID=3131939 RepID=A0ABZ3H6K6_9BACT